jgi:four helix bundle protein
MKEDQRTLGRLVVLEVALEVVEDIGAILDGVRAKDRGLEDQLKRASQSIALNLAEAAGNRRGNRRNRLETALGSAYETRTALRIVRAWGYAPKERVDRALRGLDRVAAMTYRWLARA